MLTEIELLKDENARLRVVLEAIVKGSPKEEPETCDSYNHGDIRANGFDVCHYRIAQMARVALSGGTVTTAEGRDVRVYLDGADWCATLPDFVNLQESPAGFGREVDEAIAALEGAIAGAEGAGVQKIALPDGTTATFPESVATGRDNPNYL